MRPTLTALLTAVLLNSTAELHAHPTHSAQQVHQWYHRYLHRHPDAHGLSGHVWALEHGTPAEVVQARIIASPEYYQHHGGADRAFVFGLLQDLGRDSRHVNFYVSRLHQLGCRETFALELLRGVHAPAAVAVPVPAPVVETYRPAYPVYAGPVYVPQVYRAPVYAPTYPVRSTWFEGSYSRPGFSLGVGISR